MLKVNNLIEHIRDFLLLKKYIKIFVCASFNESLDLFHTLEITHILEYVGTCM